MPTPSLLVEENASNTQQAAQLMSDFANRTGLNSSGPGRRYLWTDAFAVRNFLALARITHQGAYAEQALRLVDRVHHTLGRHRNDELRAGWLSGLGDAEGESRPTCAGLRIGKPLPERRPEEGFDERLEWERDGQYFHYLTQWMRALNDVSHWTKGPRFNLWARELAQAAHRAFVRRPPGARAPRMYWKMSIDLSRPLVPSMGQHDPLDGLITYTELETSAPLLPSTPAGPDLEQAITDFFEMSSGLSLMTADPLGLGGLLMDACRVESLMRNGAFADGILLRNLLETAVDGLSVFVRQPDLAQPPSRRLAFRELGLAIGLIELEHAGIELLAKRCGDAYGMLVRRRIEALAHFLPLGAEISAFWLRKEHRQSITWSEHRDINEVMLATSLLAGE